MELNKNDDIEVTVESLGYRGEGVARIDRVPVFIAGALPGERVRAHVILVKKDYAVAKLTEVLTRSADRTQPRCKYFGKCGGCNIQHMRYAAQLEYKRGAVADALQKIAHIDAEVGECVPSEEYGYRNKLSLPVRQSGGTAVGLFAYNSHRVVEIDDCPLQTDGVRKIIPRLREAAKYFAPYDETSGKGELRHFVMRDLGGRISLTVIATRADPEKVKKACADIGADEVWLNVNTAHSNVIMGDRTTLVAGEQKPHTVCGISVYVHPKAFLQVNDGVMQKLYSAVTERIKTLRAERIIDAYSGGGTLTALLAPYARELIGVEIERAAVDSARDLARRMGLTNVRHICGDCARILPTLAGNANIGSDIERIKGKTSEKVGKERNFGDIVGEGTESPAAEGSRETNTVIILDPPRSGCDKSVIDAVNSSSASVIYISCNPSTLARDLALLTNYAPVSITPFDMFPQTCHVETLVVLSHKKPDGHIGVKVEFGEGEGQISLKEVEKRAEERKPKEKVTYKMIQEYIEKTYGFKVHTAYIAEVKRSLGLPMYDAPNAVEELKRPRSHPSPQMVEAIKETLKHFEII